MTRGGRASRDKGNRTERAIVRLLLDPGQQCPLRAVGELCNRKRPNKGSAPPQSACDGEDADRIDQFVQRPQYEGGAE